MKKITFDIQNTIMEAHHIPIKKTAHYYTLGKPGKHIKNWWIVCHGYGQAANKFIYKFEEVIDEQTFVLAPEGFSRFYFDQFSGKVGASWMTKEDRLDEIEDYCNYLDLLYTQYRDQLSEDVRIHLLGFSQGGATQCRWIHARRPNFDNLILWACDFPNDLDYAAIKSYMENKKAYLILGDQDQFLTPDRLSKIKAFMDEQGFVREEWTFEGKHVVDRPTLRKLNETIKL